MLQLLMTVRTQLPSHLTCAQWCCYSSCGYVDTPQQYRTPIRSASMYPPLPLFPWEHSDSEGGDSETRFAMENDINSLNFKSVSTLLSYFVLPEEIPFWCSRDTWAAHRPNPQLPHLERRPYSNSEHRLKQCNLLHRNKMWMHWVSNVTYGTRIDF